MFDSDINTEVNTKIGDLTFELQGLESEFSIRSQMSGFSGIYEENALSFELDQNQDKQANLREQLANLKQEYEPELKKKAGWRSIINLGRIPDLINVILSGPSFLIGGVGLASFTLISDFGQDLIFDIIPDMSKARKTLKILEFFELCSPMLDSNIQNLNQKSSVKVATGPQIKNVFALQCISALSASAQAYNEFMKQEQEIVKTNFIKVNELKVNSESDSNEIYIQKFRKKGEGTIMVFLEGLSLYPVFEPGSRIPVRITRRDAEYNVGDLVVFKRGPIYVVHVVFGKYTDTNGKIKYQTGGLNYETNPNFDRGELTGDQILGIADLSEEFLAGILALESQGLLFEMKAYGMIN